MSIEILDLKEHLKGITHSGTLNKVRNFESACERAANTMLLKVRPVESIRYNTLSQVVHNDLNNYALPSDFNSLIDLFPQGERTIGDKGYRFLAERFDSSKSIKNKIISIEGSEGGKFIRINWKIRSSKVLNTNDSYNGNGTWTAVGTASNIQTDTVYKYSGGGSVRFDLSASGDGIQNTGMTQLNLTDEDEISDVIIPIYFSSVSNLTSITARWGNDVTSNYWTAVAQTAQADGTAFRSGWNLVRFSWASATETGTVAPSTIDSFKLTFTTTGTMNDIRVDNILFSIGSPFEIKYYSKFLFKNSSGTFITKPTSDSDVLVLDNDAQQIFILELLKAVAQQIQGEDSVFDINYANSELPTLYQSYKGDNPDQAKKAITSYGGMPRFRK